MVGLLSSLSDLMFDLMVELMEKYGHGYKWKHGFKWNGFKWKHGFKSNGQWHLNLNLLFLSFKPG